MVSRPNKALHPTPTPPLRYGAGSGELSVRLLEDLGHWALRTQANQSVKSATMRKGTEMGQYWALVSQFLQLLPILVFVVAVVFLLWRPDASRSILTLGTALLSLYARKDDISALFSFEIPAFLLLAMLILGIVLAVGGILGIVVPFGRMKDWLIEQWNKWFESPMYRCRRAKASELETVRSLAKSFFGDGVSDLQRMRNWQKKNGRLFWILLAERTRRGES